MFQPNIVEKIKIDILCPITNLEIPVVYEIKRKDMVDPDRPQMSV
jgi:hypothetical protein